jgi:hypothetical protein
MLTSRRRVPSFVHAHFCDDLAAFLIVLGQLPQMSVQVLDDLALGFG